LGIRFKVTIWVYGIMCRTCIKFYKLNQMSFGIRFTIFLALLVIWHWQINIGVGQKSHYNVGYMSFIDFGWPNETHYVLIEPCCHVQMATKYSWIKNKSNNYA
jgi:hypothetical protein